MDALLKKTDICINNPKNSSTNKMKLQVVIHCLRNDTIET